MFLTVEEPKPEFVSASVFGVHEIEGRYGTSLMSAVFERERIDATIAIAAIDATIDGTLERAHILESHFAKQVETPKGDATLIGLLPNARSADLLSEVELPPSISRPSLFSKRGAQNTYDDVVPFWQALFFRKVDLIVVNHIEATFLLDRTVESISQMKDAAKGLFDQGARTVLLTGGHLDGIVRDYCYDGTGLIEFGADQIRTKDLHGVGDVHAAFLLSKFARTGDVLSAVEFARDEITRSISNARETPFGHCPVVS